MKPFLQTIIVFDYWENGCCVNPFARCLCPDVQQKRGRRQNDTGMKLTPVNSNTVEVGILQSAAAARDNPQKGKAEN